MKRRLLGILLLTTLLMTACGAKNTDSISDASLPQSDSGAWSTSVQKESARQSSAGFMAAMETRNDSAPPTDDEILAAYKQAAEAYGWFDLASMPCSGEPVTAGGQLYQKVDYPGITSLEDLKTYLGELFSAELVTRLLPEDQTPPLYLDVDGALYVRPFARGADLTKGAATAAVEKVSDTYYLVNVSVETLADDLQTVTGVECTSFPYQLLENGRWVFTDFRLVS